jgi:hypothetical protein
MVIYVAGIFLCLGIIFNTVVHFLYHSLLVEDVLALSSAVKAGAVSVAGVTRDEFINYLSKIQRITRLHYLCVYDRYVLLTYRRLVETKQQMILEKSDGRIRRQPFGICISGPPGTGKTTIAIELANRLLQSIGFENNVSNIVVINETDQFQSEFRTDHKAVIFDDINQDKPDHATVNPFRKCIDFINNIKKTALNPNLEMKGNVYIEPEIVIITTNHDFHCENTFLHSSFWVYFPEAIARRFPFNIKIDFEGNERIYSVHALGYDMDNIGVIFTKETIIDDCIREFLIFRESQIKHVESVNSQLLQVTMNILYILLLDFYIVWL